VVRPINKIPFVNRDIHVCGETVLTWYREAIVMGSKEAFKEKQKKKIVKI